MKRSADKASRKPTGRIKAGEGVLIGNAGEYYVIAELLKRGVVAALTPRNTPAFDVLATKGNRTVRIRVKTKSAQYSIWQWQVKLAELIIYTLERSFYARERPVLY